MTPGFIVVLNGAPRSGKTSLARALQQDPERIWINWGVDAYAGMIPERLRPGIGLRPGGERPDLEAELPRLFFALYDGVAAMSRAGLNVVVDVGHHDGHSARMGILPSCAKRLDGLPALFVGVRCPLDQILARRAQAESGYVRPTPDDPVPEPVRRWQEEVHRPGIYDLNVDTAEVTPAEGAAMILRHLEQGRTGEAFARLASMATKGSA